MRRFLRLTVHLQRVRTQRGERVMHYEICGGFAVKFRWKFLERFFFLSFSFLFFQATRSTFDGYRFLSRPNRSYNNDVLFASIELPIKRSLLKADGTEAIYLKKSSASFASRKKKKKKKRTPLILKRNRDEIFAIFFPPQY